MGTHGGYSLGRSLVQLILEATFLCVVAVAATLVIAGVRSANEPTANPVGMDVTGFILLVLAVLVPAWRFFRRGVRARDS